MGISIFSQKGLLPMGISIFFLKIPPIFKLEVGFFSDRKTFAQNDFPGKFYYFGTNYERSFKRFAEHFLIGREVGHSLPRFARWLGEGRRSWAYTRLGHQVERLRCTRLRHRTCKTSGSSQKKGLLPMGISIFFSQNTPDFQTWSWIFFR